MQLTTPITRLASLLLIMLLTLVLVSTSYAERSTGQRTSKKILVSVKPLALIIDSIKNAEDEVEVLIPPGATPHDFQLRPSDLKKIADADFIIWFGADYEPFLGKALAKGSLLRDPSVQSLDVMSLKSLSYLKLTGLDTHKSLSQAHAEHHSQGNLSQGNKDPHIWLDPNNAFALAREISARLNYPATNAQLFEQELNNKLMSGKRKVSGSKHSLMVFHDAYGYLNKYNQKKQDFIIQKSHSSQPGLKQLKMLNEILVENKKQSITTCILSSLEHKGSKLFHQLNKNTDIRMITIDPLAGEKDYKNYREYFIESQLRYQSCFQ